MLAKPEKMKIVGDVKKSNDRMRALLVDVCTTAAEALKAAREAESDGERWRHLGAGVGALRSMLRPKPETLAFFTEVDYYLRHDGHLRWTADGGAGTGPVYTTPISARDFVLLNPPMGDLPPGADGVEAHSEPIDPKAPKMERGGKPWSVCDIVNIPEVGIEFKSVHTKTYHKYFCYWHAAENSDEHVYEVTVSAHAEDSWQTTALSDGREIFALFANSRRKAIELGLAAMRRWLICGHRCAWRTARRLAEQQADNSKAAPRPEPIADTVARQKEGL